MKCECKLQHELLTKVITLIKPFKSEFGCKSVHLFICITLGREATGCKSMQHSLLMYYYTLESSRRLSKHNMHLSCGYLEQKTSKSSSLLWTACNEQNVCVKQTSLIHLGNCCNKRTNLKGPSCL